MKNFFSWKNMNWASTSSNQLQPASVGGGGGKEGGGA